MSIRPLNPRTEADIVPSVSAVDRQPMIDACTLTERWRNQERHVVLDTHFDGGAQFLATWQAWRADPQRPQRLHYLAIEPRPWNVAAMTAIHATWPQFGSLSQQLLQVWPTLVTGFHRILLADDAITLTLIFGDLAHSVAQIDAQVDTFLLDSVAFLQHPESQQTTVTTLLGRMAAPQAILALESALPSAVAFSHSGFVFNTQSGNIARFAPRWQLPPVRHIPGNVRHAIVIGAGLAGSAAAQRLAARGWQISLIDHQRGAAQQASGNKAGIFMPTLAKDDNAGARLTRAAFLYALRLWQSLGGVGHAFAGEVCGVLQLARDADRAAAARDIAVQQGLPPEFAQWLTADAVRLLPDTAQCGGWLFAQAGWAHPAGVCEAMLAACGDRLHTYYDRNVAGLKRVDDAWHALDLQGESIAAATHVIIANGTGYRSFSQTADLPLEPIRGQVTHVPAASVPDLPVVLCGQAYITRSFDGICSVGATYDNDSDASLRRDSQSENLTHLSQMLPSASAALAAVPLSGRVGFRCVSPDRLPLVGALPDHNALAQLRGERLRDVPRLPGMYCLLAYASRGLIWASLAAELVAAQMNGEALPMERELAATLDPARFMLAALRRSRT